MSDIEKRGLHNIGKAFKWEGKKELFWIVFFLLIFFAAYGYKVDIDAARKVYEKPCYKRCQLDEYVLDYKAKNPGVQINCDYETMNCEIHGVKDLVKPFNMSGITITTTNMTTGNGT